MDSGVEPARRRGPQEPRKERLEGAPRGRTAGGFGPEVFRCARCGELQRSFGHVVEDATCGRCQADLHTCTNCKSFDTSSRWECREELPARVSPKDSKNACELFAPKIVKDLAGDRATKMSSPDDARQAFENLFKK